MFYFGCFTENNKCPHFILSCLPCRKLHAQKDVLLMKENVFLFEYQQNNCMKNVIPYLVQAHLIIPYFYISFSPQYWNDAKNTFSHKEYKWQ